MRDPNLMREFFWAKRANFRFRDTHSPRAVLLNNVECRPEIFVASGARLFDAPPHRVRASTFGSPEQPTRGDDLDVRGMTDAKPAQPQGRS